MVRTGSNGSPRLAVMNFLNEIAGDFPDAISFASGRPADAFFDLERWLAAIPAYQHHVAERSGISFADAGRWLAQYGRTNGVINELIAAQLAADDGVLCEADRVIVTAGCQEAIALCVQVLCGAPGDVIIARNPTYIGITGVADLQGVEIVPLNCAVDAHLPGELRDVVLRLRREGKTARALYLIPEFDNPTGSVIGAAVRRDMLDACAEERIVVLEDNPYGMFRFEGERTPTMYSLDQAGSVIYLGTYSKTLCPTVRIGCAVVPPTLFGDPAASRGLVAALGELKSFLTVNTSQLNQALVGGILLEEGGSLAGQVAPQVDYYRANRDRLIRCLEAELGGLGADIHWNRPEGGFFLTLELPFRFGRDEVLECANEHQVIPMPMSFFSLDGSQQQCIRIAFSNVHPEAIAKGVERLAGYVRRKIGETADATV